MNRELHYERLIQASPTRVFDLVTSPAGQREKGEYDIRARAVERKPGNECRVGLGAGMRLVGA
ncbi:MAG TPA: hypothetical protein VHS32_31075 [Streptosporangiaceae bacterium]|nr:hypothetical protein [Streptosporangiaceae bacterium]